MSNYNKLYTPTDSAIVFIDHQPQMLSAHQLLAGIEAAAIATLTSLALVAAVLPFDDPQNPNRLL